MLTEDELNEIELRLKFWEGEYWRVNEKDPLVVDVTNQSGRLMPPLLQDNKFTRDEIATFVAHAPEDVHKLLHEVRRLRGEQRR